MNTPVTVHCRADHAYPGRPLRFTWGEREYTVDAVLRQWREPAALCFLVAVAEGVAELAFLPPAERWELRQFSAMP